MKTIYRYTKFGLLALTLICWNMTTWSMQQPPIDDVNETWSSVKDSMGKVAKFAYHHPVLTLSVPALAAGAYALYKVRPITAHALEKKMSEIKTEVTQSVTQCENTTAAIAQAQALLDKSSKKQTREIQEARTSANQIAENASYNQTQAQTLHLGITGVYSGLGKLVAAAEGMRAGVAGIREAHSVNMLLFQTIQNQGNTLDEQLSRSSDLADSLNAALAAAQPATPQNHVAKLEATRGTQR